MMTEDLNLAAGERRLIEKAVARAETVSEAAALLGITRHSLRRRLEKHGIAWRDAHAVQETAPKRAPFGHSDMDIRPERRML